MNSRSRDDLICPFRNGVKRRPKALLFSHSYFSEARGWEERLLHQPDGASKKSSEDKPPFSDCREAAGISSPALTNEPLCALMMIPLKLWHPDWQLFISAHLGAGAIGKRRGEGPREGGGSGLALSPLGKQVSSLLTQITFQKWKGSVQLRLE